MPVEPPLPLRRPDTSRQYDHLLHLSLRPRVGQLLRSPTPDRLTFAVWHFSSLSAMDQLPALSVLRVESLARLSLSSPSLPGCAPS